MMDMLAPLALVDVLAILFLLLCAFLGWRRGLSGELARLFSVAAALIFGLLAYAPVGHWLSRNSRLGAEAAHAAAFLVTALGTLLILLLVRLVLKKILRVIINEAFDSVAGFLAGTARGGLILVLLFLTMNLLPNPFCNRVFGEESLIGRAVVQYAVVLLERHAGLQEKAHDKDAEISPADAKQKRN